ncbi:MAG: hypothetical protein UH851_01575, partial [Clostridia bacterium]|nr:hypothetical protein [Clostridia bacterium]
IYRYRCPRIIGQQTAYIGLKQKKWLLQKQQPFFQTIFLLFLIENKITAQNNSNPCSKRKKGLVL